MLRLVGGGVWSGLNRHYVFQNKRIKEYPTFLILFYPTFILPLPAYKKFDLKFKVRK